MNPNLLDRTISRATFNPRDLVPAFADLLAELGEPAPPMDFTEEAVDELVYRLDLLAPKGYYFGGHPGNSSDYGFWRYDYGFWRYSDEDY